jgi:hypothetical protein
MARFVLSRLRALGGVCLGLVRDTFFVRHLLVVRALWPRSRFLSALLTLMLLGCLTLAGLTIGAVFIAVRPSASGWFWPALAAGFAGLVMLELAAACLGSGLRALLRLSLDTGRHRIGALLTIAAIACLAWAARTILTDPAPTAVSVLWQGAGVGLVLASALWFERAYRRPAYPGFRDFHADVVGARRHLDRAAHGG